MRISDWSSDVCSSDLGDLGALLVEHVDSRLAAGAEHDAAAASARCLVLQHPESRQTGRGCRAHEAAAFAMRARLGRGLQHPGAQPLAAHFHQAEGGYAADLDAGAVVL